MREHLQDLSLDEEYLDMTRKTQSIKERINSLISKLETFSLQKTVRKVKRQARNWGEKHLQIIYLSKDLHLEHIKRFQNSVFKKREAIQLENENKTGIDFSPERIY